MKTASLVGLGTHACIGRLRVDDLEHLPIGYNRIEGTRINRFFSFDEPRRNSSPKELRRGISGGPGEHSLLENIFTFLVTIPFLSALNTDVTNVTPHLWQR